MSNKPEFLPRLVPHIFYRRPRQSSCTSMRPKQVPAGKLTCFLVILFLIALIAEGAEDLPGSGSELSGSACEFNPIIHLAFF